MSIDLKKVQEQMTQVRSRWDRVFPADVSKDLVENEVGIAKTIAPDGKSELAGIVTELAAAGYYLTGTGSDDLKSSEYFEALRRAGVKNKKLLACVRTTLAGMRVKTPASRRLAIAAKNPLAKTAILAGCIRVLTDNRADQHYASIYQKLAGKEFGVEGIGS